MAVFERSRPDLERFIRSIGGKYYVYLLCRSDGRPFYVGKGSGRRVLDHEMEARQTHPVGEGNPFKCSIIRKMDRRGAAILYRIDSVHEPDSEQASLDREAELISELGRFHEGGPLSNLAGGAGNRSGISPYSVEKHAATLSGEPSDKYEWATLNRFLQGIGPIKSVPIKPIRQISRILPTTLHPQPRNATTRCAYALIASVSSHGLQIETGVEVPRSFIFEDVEGGIENGVARDILKADMADVISAPAPKDEKFRLGRR
ncbi:MAG: GIY-YIG nuclease family protein [Rhodospirillaceae bacterium]